MVLAFFDSKGLIYNNYVPRGTMVSATYNRGSPEQLHENFQEEESIMASGEWFLHWDNAPVHTAAIVTDWLAARRVQMLQHPWYSPDLAPANFFQLAKVKNELAGLKLMRETSRRSGRGL
jgi:hypothetical protein